MDAKLKHLEFVQLTITRLAANSFLIRGWSVTLISALAVLSQQNTNSKFWVIALVPALVFWGLDAYFLRQERLFRKVYDSVRVKAEGNIDFSLETQPFQNSVDSWLKTTISPTVAAFHGTILLSVFFVAWCLR